MSDFAALLGFVERRQQQDATQHLHRGFQAGLAAQQTAMQKFETLSKHFTNEVMLPFALEEAKQKAELAKLELEQGRMLTEDMLRRKRGMNSIMSYLERQTTLEQPADEDHVFNMMAGYGLLNDPQAKAVLSRFAEGRTMRQAESMGLVPTQVQSGAVTFGTKESLDSIKLRMITALQQRDSAQALVAAREAETILNNEKAKLDLVQTQARPLLEEIRGVIRRMSARKFPSKELDERDDAKLRELTARWEALLGGSPSTPVAPAGTNMPAPFSFELLQSTKP